MIGPAPRVPERDKRPGVRYAVAPDGVELPVVDVTLPPFALSVSEAEQAALVERFLREDQPLARVPAPLRTLLLRLFLRRSVLARGIRRASGTFMTGMSTYLLKLGPDNLPTALATPIDRRIAAALPALAMRLRMQDVARLLADAVAPILLAHPGRPLHLLNVAGGPAVDSLNALVLLRREHPGLLDRSVSIDVLDLDDAGPTFGERALAALKADGAPLHGLAIAFRHLRYDWSRAAELRPVLDAARAAEALVAGSSEGGLFEYGSDDEIVANLEQLRGAGAGCAAFVGSVTRDDEPVRRLYRTSGAATRLRGLDAFRILAGRAGWEVARAVARPFSDQVALVPSAR